MYYTDRIIFFNQVQVMLCKKKKYLRGKELSDQHVTPRGSESVVNKQLSTVKKKKEEKIVLALTTILKATLEDS